MMKTIEELNKKMDGWDLVRLAYELLGYKTEDRNHCPSGFYYQCGHEGELCWDYPANYCYDLNEVRNLEEIVLQKWKEYYQKREPELCKDNPSYIECEIYTRILDNLQKTHHQILNMTQREWFVFWASARQRLLTCILSLQELTCILSLQELKEKS